MKLTADHLLQFFTSRMGLARADVELTTPLFSSGTLDSFSLVDLILFLEQRGGFRFDPADVRIEHLDSIARILDFVAAQAPAEES